MKKELTQAEREQDQADFLVDLERAAHSQDASDEWIAGFVRQYFGVKQIVQPISENVIGKRLLNACIVMGYGVSMLLIGAIIQPEKPALGIALFGLGLALGSYIVKNENKIAKALTKE